MLEICANNLAIRGRLIIIGFISGYQDQSVWKEGATPNQNKIITRLLSTSSSLRGFLLNNFRDQWIPHYLRLCELANEKKLKASIDPTPFHGLESIADAIDYLFAGKNVGKMIVDLRGPKSHL